MRFRVGTATTWPFSRHRLPRSLRASKTHPSSPRSSVSSEALPFDFLLHPLVHSLEVAGTTITHELELEATLHVTSMTAVQCMEMYGPAPDLDAQSGWRDVQEETQLDMLMPTRDIEFRLQLLRGSHLSENVKDMAVCLATPPEGSQDEDQRPVRVGNASSNRASFEEQIRVVEASPRAQPIPAYSEILLQQSRVHAAARRQRRRALIRIIRAGKRVYRSFVSLALTKATNATS